MRRVFAVFMIILTAVSFGSCAKEKRFDYSELNMRIKELNEEFCFNAEDIFCSDDTYYVYYSVFSESDMLLCMKHDSESKLSRLTLSILSGSEDALSDKYREFCKVLTQIFIYDCDIKALEREIKLDDAGTLFSDDYYTYKQGKYTAVFFNSPVASSYILDYVP